MISIIVAVKDCKDLAAACLDSLVHTVRVLGLQPLTEFILIDDDSRPDSGILELFRTMRSRTTSSVRALRFKKHQHYTYSVALGMSLSRGDCVMFFSHDMVVPPACIATLLAHADRHPDCGIIRPVSQHMDLAIPAQVQPPMPPRSLTDVCSFARCVAHCCSNQVIPQATVVGDAMLITRRCLDAIGVLDTRFVGFMGDLDYGLRARHAGFAPIVARDAWLHHWGAAASKEAVDREAKGLIQEARPELGLPMIHNAFAKFRAKWDAPLPEDFDKLTTADFERLAALPRASLKFPLHEAALAVNPVLCEEV